MLNEIQIQNFRGIKDLKISNFSKVNIFVGKANTGKTSILEALYIYLAEEPHSIIKILEFRQLITDEDSFQSFFYDYDLQNKPIICKNSNEKLEIDCDRSSNYMNIPINNQQNIIVEPDNGISEINFTYTEQNGDKKKINTKKTFLNFGQIQFQQSGAIFKANGSQVLLSFPLLSNVEFMDSNTLYKGFIDNLKIIMGDKDSNEKLRDIYKKFSNNSEIEDIRFIEQRIVVQQSNLKHTINFKLLGEGFKRYVCINASILAGKKYILIDEIENGLHFEGIKKLLETILNINDDVQFFITTHNQEILEKLGEILYEEKEEKVSIFNVYQKNQKINVFRLTQKDFVVNIENKSEIRD